MSSTPHAKRASMPLALLLVVVWAMVGLLGFALQWRTLAATPLSPSPEQLAATQGGIHGLFAMVTEILFLLALIYPAWAVANRAPGESVKRWMRPVALLAFLVALTALQALLIHLRGPRGSLLWDQQFGVPLRTDLHPTATVLLFEILHSVLAALTTLAVGLFAVGAAARFSAKGKRPMFGFLTAAIPLAVGHLVLQWFIHSRELWRMDYAVTGGICAVLLVLSAPLWFRLDRGAKETTA